MTIGESRADMKNKLLEIVEEMDKAETLEEGSEEQYRADQMAVVKLLIVYLVDGPSNSNSYASIISKENERRRDPRSGPPLTDIKLI